MHMKTSSSVILESTEMKDPFSQWNTFSLLPKTFRSFKKSMAADHQELGPLQNLLSSMKSEDQMKLIEQAATILNSNLDFSNHDVTSQILSNDQVSTTTDNQPKRERLGLGHKRARFSLMHSKSEPVTQADPKAVLDQLEDPDEYFAALERIEFAEKEKKRLRGDTGNEPTQPNRERIRRPGLNLGRKSSYRHVYPKFTSNAENLDHPLGSKSEGDVLSPSKATLNSVSEATDKPAGSWERDTQDDPLDALGKDPELDKENKSGSSLSEVLNVCRDLDDSQTLKLLQERFGLQSLGLDKQKVPELDASPSSGHKTFQGALRSPKLAASVRQPLTASTDTLDLVSARQKSVEKLIRPSTGSSPVRRPQSLVSASGAHISLIVTETDPVSLHNTVARTSQSHFSSDKGIHTSSSPPVCVDKTCDGGSSFLLKTPNEKTNEKVISHSIDRTENNPSTVSITHAKPTPMSEKRMGLNSRMHTSGNEAGSLRNFDFDSEALVRQQSSSQVDMLTGDSSTEFEKARECNSGSISYAKPSPSMSEKRTSLNSRMQTSENEAGNIRNCDFDSQARVGQQSSSQVDMLSGDSSIESEKAREYNSGSIRHANPTPSMSEKRMSLNGRMQTSGNEAGSIRNRDFDSEALVGQQSSNEVDMLTGDSSIESEKARDKSHGRLVAEEVIQDFTIESVHEGSQFDKRSSTTTSHPMDENAEKTNLVPEQINQELEIQIPPSTSGRKARRKVPSSKPRKKECQSKFSLALAGAGTSWEGGTRRSTRVRSKPLQWWKGEQFLYGRVHGSLVTVIGAKYVTSDDDKKVREFEVVSFV
ncbi:hypothetical protein H6P81_008108 [Aristolochia fimbriata]|uniref:Centromere protein C n=1 Tax=Aristolochia fimbriata TaxID=158543 RepID=A0AAV7F2S5_ARIFI|nr:hypothetical protein H6P81_008108 [Aristolochia fimbriata]